MTITDQKTIVKRIADSWREEKDALRKLGAYPHLKEKIEAKMLCYRYALEFSGLTLNEIISLGNADDLNKAVDELFNKIKQN